MKYKIQIRIEAAEPQFTEVLLVKTEQDSATKAISWAAVEAIGKMKICQDDRQHSTILPSKNDPVNHPKHYGGEIECKDAIREAVRNYRGWAAKCAGDVIKYIWRAYDKNGIEDLKKALAYMQFLISEGEKGEGYIFISPRN